MYDKKISLVPKYQNITFLKQTLKYIWAYLLQHSFQFSKYSDLSDASDLVNIYALQLLLTEIVTMTIRFIQATCFNFN